MANGYSKQIRERIGNALEGTVFVNSDFTDITDTETIRRNLNRLTETGTLRRILKGIYEKPEYSEILKEYAEVLSGTLKLLPPDYRFPALLADYEAMTDMLYGDIPDFDTVMSVVRELEKEINSL